MVEADRSHDRAGVGEPGRERAGGHVQGGKFTIAISWVDVDKIYNEHDPGVRRG